MTDGGQERERLAGTGSARAIASLWCSMKMMRNDPSQHPCMPLPHDVIRPLSAPQVQALRSGTTRHFPRSLFYTRRRLRPGLQQLLPPPPPPYPGNRFLLYPLSLPDEYISNLPARDRCPPSRLERASNCLVQLRRKVPHVVRVQPRHRNTPVCSQVDVRLLHQRLALRRVDSSETAKAKHNNVSLQFPPAFRPPVSPSSAVIMPDLLPLIGSNALPPANQSVQRQPARHLLSSRETPDAPTSTLQPVHCSASWLLTRASASHCPCRDQARVLRPSFAHSARPLPRARNAHSSGMCTLNAPIARHVIEPQLSACGSVWQCGGSHSALALHAWTGTCHAKTQHDRAPGHTQVHHVQARAPAWAASPSPSA